MKKFSCITLSALAISLITTITHATDVYLENSYGAIIKYIVAEASTSPKNWWDKKNISNY